MYTLVVRLILDACTIIYLIKANLQDEFIKISNVNIVIDKEVYTEVVENGKKNSYPDALIAEKFLIENKIPIIPTDIKKYLYLFRDYGETSCFILAKDEGVCITSDKRAFNKFEQQKVNVKRLDTYLYSEWIKKKYPKEKIITFLDSLLNVYATTPERYAVFIKKLI